MRKEYGPDRNYDGMLFRVARFDGEVRADDRSIPIVLASEAPVQTFDFAKRDIVDEVLHVDGMDLPKQVPLLDSHNRESVRSVMGSIRDLERKTVNGVKSIVGRAYFAADADSQRAFQNYADGHSTDFSVGARRLEVKNFGNRRDVTRSRLLEGSAVVIGADSNAKSFDALALRAYSDPQALKEEAMNKEMRDLLIARGMPADLDDVAAIKWAGENMDRKAAPTAQSPVAPVAAAPKVDADEIARKSADAEIERITGIDELCRTHKMPDKDRGEWIKSRKLLDEVSREILARLATAGRAGTPIEGGKSQIEKFSEAAHDSLLVRSIFGSRLSPQKALEKAQQDGDSDAIQRNAELTQVLAKPAAGASELRGFTLGDIAERFIEEAGIRTYGMPKPEIVRQALRMDLLQRDHAFNTTGSFTNVLLNTMNKTMLAAYDEAATTYQTWVRRAPSAQDFRDLNRIRFGELPDPEVVPENGKYPDKTTSDAREKYSVDKYGEIFSVTMETIVNDDLNAISRIPAMQGNAMRRKINKVCYAVLTDNAALSDGVALFHTSSHGANLDAAALASAALNTGFVVMMTQQGLTSGTILNIMPKYLIVPPALASTAYILASSMTDPSNTAGSTEDARRPNYPAGVPNMYGPSGPRALTVVVDGHISTSQSATVWYLAADPSQVDTVELTFLAGEESPVLSREEGFDVDAVRYKIRQTFAAKAIDYRGLYQGNA